MTRVLLRRSGSLLFLHGPAPTKSGDRFKASSAPTPAPRVEREPGCKLVPTVEGAAFVCTRRGPGGGARADVIVKDYVFNPEIHELLP